jgi:hypothetical protein
MDIAGINVGRAADHLFTFEVDDRREAAFFL